MVSATTGKETASSAKQLSVFPGLLAYWLIVCHLIWVKPLPAQRSKEMSSLAMDLLACA